MNKVIIFAFRGDPMCFVHVLLNGLDLAEKGMGGKIIIEGDAVKLVAEMSKPDNFLHPLYQKAKKKDLFVGACKACSTKLKVSGSIEDEDIPLIGEMAGHPSMADYMNRGYTVITF